MDSRTKIFRAHRALAWFYALLGVGVSAAVVLSPRDKMGMGMFLVPLIFVGIVLLHYFTAGACRDGKPGGRVASIVIACLMLLGFPIGTIIGVYLLANTWKPWANAPNPT
jgi:hypothetical protein